MYIRFCKTLKRFEWYKLTCLKIHHVYIFGILFCSAVVAVTVSRTKWTFTDNYTVDTFDFSRLLLSLWNIIGWYDWQFQVGILASSRILPRGWGVGAVEWQSRKVWVEVCRRGLQTTSPTLFKTNIVYFSTRPYFTTLVNFVPRTELSIFLN